MDKARLTEILKDEAQSLGDGLVDSLQDLTKGDDPTEFHTDFLRAILVGVRLAIQCPHLSLDDFKDCVAEVEFDEPGEDF